MILFILSFIIFMIFIFFYYKRQIYYKPQHIPRGYIMLKTSKGQYIGKVTPCKWAFKTSNNILCGNSQNDSRLCRFVSEHEKCPYFSKNYLYDPDLEKMHAKLKEEGLSK